MDLEKVSLFNLFLYIHTLLSCKLFDLIKDLGVFELFAKPLKLSLLRYVMC